MYIADGDYIRDIEVNDLRNRYTLTKGSTQKMVNTPHVAIPLIDQALVQFSTSTTCSHLFKILSTVWGKSSLLKRDSTHYKNLCGIC